MAIVRFSITTLLRRLRLRLEEVFDAAWAGLPAQPLITASIFAATAAVILIDIPPIAFDLLNVGGWVFYAWCTLGLLGPVALAVSHQLITQCRRQKRLFGFWLRTAADLVLALALAAYLAARILAPGADDSTVYSLVILGGIWVLQLLWVARDVWALVLIEQTATRLHGMVYERE